MRTQQGLHVPNGEDRSEEELKIWGAIPLQIKVSTEDTDGALFVFEHADMGKGGPPRHFHHEQDEWFYVIEGDFAFEVGDERFALGPGDSLLAAQMVPHGWAHDSLEAFFRQGCEMTSLPTPEEADRMFADHGMKVVGPPLDVD